MMKLQHKVSVYVCMPNQVQTVANMLSGLYGGATVTQGTGYWLDDNGKMWEDPTNIVTSYCMEQPNVHHIETIVREIFLNSAELAVSVEMPGMGLVIYDRADLLTVAELAA